MVLSSLAIASFLAFLSKPPAKPHPCHALSESNLKEAMTLSEPCYVVSEFTSVHVPLTVQAGTTIYFGQGASLVLEDGGSLHAVGTASAPVVFRGKEHAPGYWNGLSFSSRSPNNQLSYAVVEDAGSTDSTDSAAVEVSVGAMLAMDNTTIRNTAGNGLFLNQRAVLRAFSTNHFENNDTPVSVKASDLNMLDGATTFTGNKHQSVLVHFNDSTVSQDETWHALAVPYLFACTPSLQAHITIEPGALLKFQERLGITVEDNGSLTAEGTADKPVTFTAAETTPGFWDGIVFETNSPQNILRNTVVTYAGQQDGVAKGNVGLSPQAGATVQSSEIGWSATAAIRVGQNARLNADAKTSNRFHDNAAGIVVEQ